MANTRLGYLMLLRGGCTAIPSSGHWEYPSSAEQFLSCPQLSSLPFIFSAAVAYPAVFQAVKLGDCKSSTYFTVETVMNKLWNLKLKNKYKNGKVWIIYGTKAKMEESKHEKLYLCMKNCRWLLGVPVQKYTF